MFAVGIVAKTIPDKRIGAACGIHHHVFIFQCPGFHVKPEGKRFVVIQRIGQVNRNDSRLIVTGSAGKLQRFLIGMTGRIRIGDHLYRCGFVVSFGISVFLAYIVFFKIHFDRGTRFKRRLRTAKRKSYIVKQVGYGFGFVVVYSDSKINSAA